MPKVGMFRDTEGRIRSLSREEYERLISELPKHLADMAQFLVATGLRQANVTGLRWKQISLERRHLWVSGGEHKNGRPHSVPLNESAIVVLQRRQGDHPTRVFTYEGNPIFQVNTKAWRNALLRAGIHDFCWHDLRIPLQLGIAKRAHLPTNFSGLVDGKLNPWSSAMRTLLLKGYSS